MGSSAPPFSNTRSTHGDRYSHMVSVILPFAFHPVLRNRFTQYLQHKYITLTINVRKIRKDGHDSRQATLW